MGVGETRSLTIVKNTVPNGPQDFLFQSDCDEFSPSFTLDDDLDGTNPNMLECTPASGTYFVTEVAVPGYATSIVCDDPASTTIVGLTVTVELDDGEFITCTYTNTALPAGMTFQKIASKSAITSDPPEAFSWIYILTNTGGLPLTGVNISDPDLDAGTGFIVLDPDPQMDSNCTASGQPGSLTCIFPDPLDPGGSISVQVGMRAVPGTPSGPVVSNTAFAGSNDRRGRGGAGRGRCRDSRPGRSDRGPGQRGHQQQPDPHDYKELRLSSGQPPGSGPDTLGAVHLHGDEHWWCGCS